MFQQIKIRLAAKAELRALEGDVKSLIEGIEAVLGRLELSQEERLRLLDEKVADGRSLVSRLRLLKNKIDNLDREYDATRLSIKLGVRCLDLEYRIAERQAQARRIILDT